MSSLIYIAVGGAAGALDESIKDGFVTMEKVRIIKYGDR